MIHTKAAQKAVEKIDRMAEELGEVGELMIHLKLPDSDVYHRINTAPSEFGPITSHNTIEVVSKAVYPGEKLTEDGRKRKW